MGLIPDSVIGEIRERSDIVAVIGQHVQLRKAGQNHKGLCPFHNENTPSFNVNGPKGFFYCFGCQKKGDVFTFIMEYEGKSFVEAAESLAGQLGVEIPKLEEPEHVRRQRSERSQLLRVNKLAAEFFRQQLCSASGAEGRRYLEERGIGEAVREHFQLGLAPDNWHVLSEFLDSKRVPMQLAVTLGLVGQQPKAGGYYDRFRGRLMCPVILPGGEIAGFSGRRLASADGADAERAGAKYINSPESAVYKKSKLLFGLHRARDAFRKSKRAILVEGNFDVIALHQAGFAETVAPLGTALTSEQVDQLRRLAEKVVLMYDGDKAGRAATLKALQVLVAADVDVRIVVLPPGEDPDTLVKRLGEERFGELVGRAQGGIQYFAYEVWGKNTGSDHSQAEVLEQAATVLNAIKNPTKRDFVVGTLAKALDVDPAVVRRSMQRSRQDNYQEKPRQSPEQRLASAAPPPQLELAVLAILAEYPQLVETAEQNSVFSLLTDDRLRDMYCAARQDRSYLSNPSGWPQEISSLIAKQILAGAYADVKDPTHCLTEAIGGLKRLQQRARLAALKREAQVAKRRGDVELERKLVKEILTTRRQVD